MARKKEHLRGIELVKAQLQTPGTQIKYQFKLNTEVKEYIVEENIVSSTDGEKMDIESFGPKCMWVTDKDMAGNITRAKIRYEDVDVVSSDFVDPLNLVEPEVEAVDEIVEEEEFVEVEA